MHILVIRLSAIGDVVLTLPAVAALRRSFPEARISWAVGSKARELLEGSPLLDQIIEVETAKWNKRRPGEAWRSAAGAFRRLRENPVDVALDFQGLLKSALVARLSGARRRLGFATDELRERAGRAFLTEQIGRAEGGHVIEKNLRLAEALGARRPAEYEFPIAVPPGDEAFVQTELARHDLDQFAILNPGGGWVTKLWAPHNYSALADWLWRTHGLRTVVTYGPGEEGLARSVAQASRRATPVALATSLKQFVALARRARLFVGGDTGPMHLAAAAGAPIVALFGPTAAHRNGPFAPRDVSLGRDVPCREGCYRRTCSEWICMEIPVTQVQRAVEQRLESAGRRQLPLAVS